MKTMSMVLLASAAGLLTGCGGGTAGGNAAVAHDFKLIGLAYHAYVDTHKKGPTNATELFSATAFTTPQDLQDKERMLKALGEGKYVVIWGVQALDLVRKGAAGDLVLGYEQQAPTKGGMVLFADATTKSMTAAEFQAAKKAGS